MVTPHIYRISKLNDLQQCNTQKNLIIKYT